MALVRRSFLAAAALVLMASAAPAQDAAATASAVVAVTDPSLPIGPRLETTRVGARSHAAVVAAEPAAPAPMRRADTKRSRTLMIIGGAALLGGAIIGDDAGQIIMLGGLGVGLYGLYLHLQ